MAKVQRYVCDSCGGDIDGEPTKEKVKLDGPDTKAEYERDLCEQCVVIPQDVKVKPLRTRVVKPKPDAQLTNT